MTTRTAEFLMAVVMGAFSLYLMWKSAELRIDWIRGEGPGGGAWPFWLAFGMLLCCVATLVRWYLRLTPESRSTEPFMSSTATRVFALTAGSLLVLLLAIHVIGVYFAIPLFMLYYMRFFGRHSWLVTGLVALTMPVGAFMFFEVAMKIPLPKGYTEPLFYPIYAIVY